MLLKMKRLFALFALLALVLAPFAFASAAAAPSREPCPSMQHHKVPDGNPAEHGCCTPSLSPLPEVPATAPAPRPSAPPALVVRLQLVPPLDSPMIELPPPRNG